MLPCRHKAHAAHVEPPPYKRHSTQRMLHKAIRKPRAGHQCLEALGCLQAIQHGLWYCVCTALQRFCTQDSAINPGCTQPLTRYVSRGRFSTPVSPGEPCSVLRCSLTSSSVNSGTNSSARVRGSFSCSHPAVQQTTRSSLEYIAKLSHALGASET